MTEPLHFTNLPEFDLIQAIRLQASFLILTDRKMGPHLRPQGGNAHDMQMR